MKTTIPEIKVTTPEAASAAALKPLIDFATKNRGTIITLADILSKRTGQTIFRQSVEKWLHPKIKKRMEPKLGIGLLLIEEGAKLIANTNAVADNEKAALK